VSMVFTHQPTDCFQSFTHPEPRRNGIDTPLGSSSPDYGGWSTFAPLRWVPVLSLRSPKAMARRSIRRSVRASQAIAEAPVTSHLLLEKACSRQSLPSRLEC
jgi:hypothetical protein